MGIRLIIVLGKDSRLFLGTDQVAQVLPEILGAGQLAGNLCPTVVGAFQLHSKEVILGVEGLDLLRFKKRDGGGIGHRLRGWPLAVRL